MTAELPAELHHCACSICQSDPEHPTARQHTQMNLFLSRLSEPQRRWYVGLLSTNPDVPSDEQLSLITGLSLPTIRRGRNELAGGLADTPPSRQRRAGAGRPRAEKKIPR